MSELAESSERPLLSVVVPVYNVAEWLTECLESIRRQSFSEFEVLIINDGSTDSSLQIAEGFCLNDARFSVHSFENGGLGMARNRGIALARGAYISFPDSDDRLPVDAFEVMMDSLRSSGSQIVAGRAADFYSGPDKFLTYWTTSSSIYSQKKQGLTVESCPDLILDHTAWNKIFALDFIRDNAIRFSENTSCEDVLFSAVAITRASSVDVVSNYVYEHRRRHGAISNSLFENRFVSEWLVESGKVADVIRAQSSEKVTRAYAKRMLESEAYNRAKHMSLAWPPPLVRQFADFIDFLREFVPADVFDELPLAVKSLYLGLSLQFKTPEDLPREPQLSVVVPTKNVGPWLDECLYSIFRQGIDSIEVLLVDDGSTDDTLLVASEFVEAGLVRYFNTFGAGGGTARNIGIQHAVGEYIAFADGDDIVADGAYRTMIDRLAGSGSDMVVMDYMQFSVTNSWSPNTENELFRDASAITIADRPELLLNRYCWNKLFRRSFFLEARISFPDVRRANDLVPMTRAYLEAASIEVAAGCSYLYRRRPGTTSMSAQVGSTASMVGYLEQVNIALDSVRRKNDASLTAAFLSMLVQDDLWTHLKTFFDSPDSRTNSGLAVISAASAVINKIPNEFFDGLPDQQRIVYFLIKKADVNVLLNMQEKALSIPNLRLSKMFGWREALLVLGYNDLDLDWRQDLFARGVVDRILRDLDKLRPAEFAEAQRLVASFARKRQHGISNYLRSIEDKRRMDAIISGAKDGLSVYSRSLTSPGMKRARKLAQHMPAPMRAAAVKTVRAGRRLQTMASRKGK